MLDLPRAAFSRLPRASDPLHLPVSKPVGVLARTFQGVTPSFHPSEYQFSGISAVHSLFSYKRVALFPWSTAINIAMYLLYFSYTDAIRIRATKIGSFRKNMPVHKGKAGGRDAAPGFLRLNSWVILRKSMCRGYSPAPVWSSGARYENAPFPRTD